MTGLEFLGAKQVNWFSVANNHILDLSKVNGKLTDTNPYLENQTVTETEQRVELGVPLILKVKNIKNIDGSMPDIIPNNGGIYDKEKGIITWTGLTKDTNQVTYLWKGNGATTDVHKFSGKGTVPVSYEEGQAQIMYNANQIDPDDPTANPDFTVLIPSIYQLSDRNLKTAAPGEVSLKDAQDISKNYTGEQTVNLSIASTKNFTFDNGGEYKLVKEDGPLFPTSVLLSKSSSKVAANVLITNLGTKKASTNFF